MRSLKVVAVDMLAGGLVLGFSDGSSGFFSHSLLFDSLAHAHGMSGEEIYLETRLIFSTQHG